MKHYSKEDMRKGLDFYSPETRVFPAIAAAAQGPQKLTKEHVLLILKWKLRRIKGSNSETVSDENLHRINGWVEKASQTGREINALKGLGKIPGIGLATATAILTICYPERFTIIDRRVLEMLDLISPENVGHWKDDWSGDWTAERYFNEYLPKVKDHAAEWGCSLREADQALWGLSVCEQIERFINQIRGEVDANLSGV